MEPAPALGRHLCCKPPTAPTLCCGEIFKFSENLPVSSLCLGTPKPPAGHCVAASWGSQGLSSPWSAGGFKDGLHQRAPSLWDVGLPADSCLPHCTPFGCLHRLGVLGTGPRPSLSLETSPFGDHPVPSSLHLRGSCLCGRGRSWGGLSGPVRSRQQQEWRGKPVQKSVLSLPSLLGPDITAGRLRHGSFGPHGALKFFSYRIKMRPPLPHGEIPHKNSDFCLPYKKKWEGLATFPKGTVRHQFPPRPSLPCFCPWSPVPGSPGLSFAGTWDCHRLGISKLFPPKAQKMSILGFGGGG